VPGTAATGFNRPERLMAALDNWMFPLAQAADDRDAVVGTGLSPWHTVAAMDNYYRKGCGGPPGCLKGWA
jgi:hypothetical protein